MIESVHDWSDFNATLARFKLDKGFRISLNKFFDFNATLARFKRK